jgi:hypothetical protein
VNPLAVGIAANLTADAITNPGPGFFIYFNSRLAAALLASGVACRRYAARQRAR